VICVKAAKHIRKPLLTVISFERLNNPLIKRLETRSAISRKLTYLNVRREGSNLNSRVMHREVIYY
jgi:hypothetical protein